MSIHTIKKYLPYVLFVAFVMAVMLPLFAPGYIFLLDMGFPPDMHVQTITGGIIPSNYPLRYILYVVAQSIGTPLTEKLLLVTILLLPGIAMYRFSKKYFSRSLAMLSGSIYMANPWVYERFFSGQWLVMAGYGMLPIFISYLVTLVNAPTKKHGIKFAVIAALYPIFSLHFAYIAYAFGFVCLPSSHPLLYEWIADFERTGQIPTRVSTRWTGKQRLIDTYRWLNDLPLRDGKDALLVGWCELTTTNAEGKVLYRNAWATSERVSEQNVVSLVAAGRSRWKIENENNNTLKTQGSDLPESAQTSLDFWTMRRRWATHTGEWPTSMRSHFPPGILAPRPVSLRHSCSWA
jgi:hypothetical protein